MAYSALPSKSTGDILTLSNYDAIKDNFAAGVPDIMTTKGDLAVATAANAAARLAVGANNAELIAASGETTGLKWQIRPSARAYSSINLDPTTSTYFALNLNSERWDSNSCHSTSSNTSRLTVPTAGAGIYEIGAGATFDTSGGTGGTFGVRLLLNGTTTIAVQQVQAAPTIALALNVSAHYALAVADYVEVEVYTTLDVNVLSAANYSPELWFTYLRPTV